MRTEFSDDLALARDRKDAIRSSDDLIERIAAGQARENNVRFFGDLRRRTRRHTAGLFELRQRAAPVAKHAVATADQMLTDLGADLADADEADGLHDSPPKRYWFVLWAQRTPSVLSAKFSVTVMDPSMK